MARGRDFARQKPASGRGGARKAAAAHPRAKVGAGAGLPVWAWLVICLAFALSGAALMYVRRPAEPMAMAPSSADQRPRKVIAVPPKEPARFAFYEMLPNYESVVPDEEPPPKPRVRPAAQPPPDGAESARAAALLSGQPAAPVPGAVSRERFLIQVAAYRSRADADQQRSALARSGLAARIEQITIDNRQTWFRVRLGPYSDIDSARAALASLQIQGQKGVLMRVKS